MARVAVEVADHSPARGGLQETAMLPIDSERLPVMAMSLQRSLRPLEMAMTSLQRKRFAEMELMLQSRLRSLAKLKLVP